MSPEEKEIYAEYTRRNTFWSEQALNQLGYSLNLFFTLNMGFLGYIITERKNYPKFHFYLGGSIEWSLMFYLIILFFVFIISILGASAIISRLYDLRITRFIIWVRKRAFKKQSRLLPDGYIDLSKESRLKNLIRILIKIDFIKPQDFKDLSTLKLKFEHLRKQQKLLGEYTWKAHRIHIGLMLLAGLLYSVIAIFG